MKLTALGAGTKLVACMLLSFAAFGARTPERLLILSGIHALIAAILRLGPRAVGRELKVFAWQTAVIVALHVLRFGPSRGLLPGFLVSWQLFLAFLPAFLLTRTTPASQLMRLLARLLPERAAFVLATSLHFSTLVVGEMRNIYEAQIIRGARILPRDLLKPRNWGDLIGALLIPAIVRSLALAHEIALAARARGLENSVTRTYWPGD